ncbi:nucleotide exchange factor GrpE [Sphingomonas sp.]|uniref:nucleotide exchange factor GrpE n=1 Tax=Sphingomonas sp. TaxID=28214 RepID=UPI001DDC927E|nr:nucleotide exchange factor GrpE [Sphingomonas sp.]MBX9795877.1 nucleotide exchange factor GrpE [Sphingomonas sp.]
MTDESNFSDQDVTPAEEAGAEAAARIAALEADLAEAKAQALYAAAEAQNVRRRAEREAADARTYAVTSFARDMLSVADNFERALAAIPDELRADEKMKGLVAGIEGTGRELEAIFTRHGIARVKALGEPLDPNLHQAVVELPSDAEPGTIVQEMQPGYKIKDRLLRPAMVAVAKAG